MSGSVDFGKELVRLIREACSNQIERGIFITPNIEVDTSRIAPNVERNELTFITSASALQPGKECKTGIACSTTEFYYANQVGKPQSFSLHQIERVKADHNGKWNCYTYGDKVTVLLKDGKTHTLEECMIGLNSIKVANLLTFAAREAPSADLLSLTNSMSLSELPDELQLEYMEVLYNYAYLFDNNVDSVEYSALQSIAVRMLKDAGIPYSQNLNTRPSGLQQCIQYLEKKFGVNYDASSAAWLDPNDLAKLPIEKQEALGSMRPQNHHLLSLAHSPDLIGLLFSILDQFTGKTSIIASGEFIRVMPKEKKNEIDQFELRGSNVISKIFCGFINWLGHCLSDLVGSNTTRADPAKRGTGLPIPGFELFQFISLPPGPQEKIAQDLADLSVKVFESGYDARFGIALSIPVITSDLLTRLTFSLKRYFYHHLPINECIPMDTKVGSITHQPELRRMLLIAHGTLCAWDVGDAVIQGVVQGNVLSAALRLNYWGYIRLSQDALAALRARCRQNHIDIDAITKCTQEEWKVLYTDAQKWIPVGLNE